MTPQSAKAKTYIKCRRCKQPFKKIKGRAICDICRTRCSSCGIQLTHENIDKSCLKNRKAYRCKECVAKGVRESRQPENQKDYDLRRNYGITLEEYETLLKAQNGVCAICLSPPTKNKLAVDHKHQSGERRLKQENGQALIRKNVRGLLCWHCNNALGKFNDNSKNLRRAASYLEDWPATKILHDL